LLRGVPRGRGEEPPRGASGEAEGHKVHEPIPVQGVVEHTVGGKQRPRGGTRNPNDPSRQESLAGSPLRLAASHSPRLLPSLPPTWLR